MNVFGLVLFGIYLCVVLIMDIAMIISLIRTGDERRQMIVWKSSTWAMIGTTGNLLLGIIKNVIHVQRMSVNPLTVLTAAATIYFICLLYYKRKHGA